MQAATGRPEGLSGFSRVPTDGQDGVKGVELWFRAAGDRVPDVLGIGMHGRRRPVWRLTGMAA
jgi:hypothetical protein